MQQLQLLYVLVDVVVIRERAEGEPRRFWWTHNSIENESVELSHVIVCPVDDVFGLASKC